MIKSAPEIKGLYESDEYVRKNPSMHTEDSAWKVLKLLPYVDLAVERIQKPVITIMDVGGGAGEILAAISEHVAAKHGRTVIKQAMDLSPRMLEATKTTNPDLALALNEDVSASSLADGSVDLTLMIDVLEHVSDPQVAIREIGRFSAFCLYKVPLEHNAYFRLKDWLKRGALRRSLVETMGHINVYDTVRLKAAFAEAGQEVAGYGFTNAGAYLGASDKLTRLDRSAYRLGAALYKASSRLAAELCPDFALVLSSAKKGKDK
jgi:SAM-dependent methyltransferase